MYVAICKNHKFSHCKFGKFCHFKHVDKKCQDSVCDAKKCDFRHPRKCLYILQKKSCKFGDFCSFEHNFEPSPAESDELSEQIKHLEEVIVSKDLEINNLEKKLDELERKMHIENSDEESFTANDEIENLDVGSFNDSDDSNSLNDYVEKATATNKLFKCEKCDFETEHKVGLKIHQSRCHKNLCEECGQGFKSNDALKRHNIAEKTL